MLLSHQVLSDPENAKKRIDQLKPKLHGKRKAVLQNIEARLIGYTKQHEMMHLNYFPVLIVSIEIVSGLR